MQKRVQFAIQRCKNKSVNDLNKSSTFQFLTPNTSRSRMNEHLNQPAIHHLPEFYAVCILIFSMSISSRDLFSAQPNPIDDHDFTIIVSPSNR